MTKTLRSLGTGAALIALLTVVVYLPALRGGFVFDDRALITENRMVKASDGLYRFWLTTEARDYYPLTSSLWWLEWRLWGNSATGYHVVSVLLHAVNAVLVWLILRRLKVPGAWLAGLVFAVHPVNVATVAWISEQKNTASMLFYAVAILLYLRFDEESRLPRTVVRGWFGSEWGGYGLSLAAFLLALLSKTAVVMLPVVLLGCVWWRHGRVRWKDFLCSVPFFVLSLVLGLVTVWYQYHLALGEPGIRTAGFASRLAGAGWAPWSYLYKAVLPFNLTVIYPKWEINTSLWVSYVPGAIMICCLVVFWWKCKTWGRPLLFGLGYFVVTLFPVLGFIQQGPYRLRALADHWDHWQYYSIVGAIALVVAAVEKICRRMGERGQFVGVLASVAVLMALGVATWKRACVYADAETLWRDNVAKNPNAWSAHYNLGVALGQSGRVQEAVGHFEQALQIEPDFAEAHYNLGNALSQEGKLEDAIGHWEQAVRINPDYAEAHYNLGGTLARLGKVQEAIMHFEQALRIKPDDAEAHYNLGSALVRVGRVQEAMGHWEQALRIKPDYAEAHYDLGVALVGLRRVQEAMGHWEQALRIKPDYAEAHYNLGVAFEQEGRTQEAIGHFEQALRIKPDYAEAQNKLARLRAVQ
jgi:protein O-mannosyl-transferase